ncbi:threonine aldolase family protein [Longispora albida]|uniref:threonine aldolase family protein n=1 Tax=Longispora albida TaxID=203523 RepID=UPI000367A957|nr:beta-eliminating lyase-related protein [Longispora albida]
MTETATERRVRLMRASERLLSGGGWMSPAERLAAIQEYAASHPLPDVYGEGGALTTLEERVAGLLGTEGALYFPTGTMAQQVALRVWAERTGNPVVAMHPLHHPEVHERHAYSALSGLRSVWPAQAPRLATPPEIAECESFGTFMAELPLREAGFVLPSWDELTASVAAARDREAVVHFDGARLWESTVHLGHTLPEITALADSVYVSFYKTLNGLSGAAVAGSEDFLRDARTWRHRYGGQLFQQWPAAMSALAGLDTILPRLPEYVAHAKVVAAALGQHAEVYPAVPHTHQFQVWLPYPAKALQDAVLTVAEELGWWTIGGWREPGRPGHSMAEVTIAERALEWSPADVTAGITALVEAAKGR